MNHVVTWYRCFCIQKMSLKTSIISYKKQVHFNKDPNTVGGEIEKEGIWIRYTDIDSEKSKEFDSFQFTLSENEKICNWQFSDKTSEYYF